MCTECMARPRFASGFIRVGLSSLQQCIRPMSMRSGHDGDPRELVLIKLSAFVAWPFRYSDFQDAGRLLGHLVIVLSQTRWDPLRFVRSCARDAAQSPAT
jgi:hypothetical protein